MEKISWIGDELEGDGGTNVIKNVSANLEDLNISCGEAWFGYDIAICFSVLPYLDEPATFTRWMAEMFNECLIEAQYKPEPYSLDVSNDDEMHKWLRDCGFEIAIPLGKTEIEIRDTFRTIWYATREKKR